MRMGRGLRYGLPVVALAAMFVTGASSPQPEYQMLEQSVEIATCPDQGMLDIFDFTACKRAAEALGVHYQTFAVVTGKPISPGCWYSTELLRLSLKLPCETPGACGNPARRGNQSRTSGSWRDSDRRLNYDSAHYLCEAAAISGEASDAPVSRAYRSAIAAGAGLCVVTCAALGACCARRRSPVDLGRSLPKQLRWSPRCGCKRGHAPRQAEVEAAARVLDERSQRLTHAVMSLFALVHTAESLGSAAAGDAPCTTGSGKARFASVCIHSAGSAILCLLLASRAWPKLRGKVGMTCMLATELSLRMSLVWLTAEAALLSPFRFQQDLVWRVLCGLCSSPLSGIAGNIVYSVAVITCFALQVPLESVAYFSEQRAGIYLADGCVSFLPGEEMRALAAFFANLNQGSSRGLVSGLGLIEENAVELLDSMPSFFRSFADNVTSLRAFMLAELLSLCIAAVVIFVVRNFMSEDVRNIVRLDSAKNNSKAVSSILSRLCDSVTCLDANLKLSSPSKQLASLLHANVAHRCQIGDDFLHHIVEEDHEQVKSILLAEDAVESVDQQNQTMNIRLRDAFGIKVRCQMLYASFRDMHGSQSFVVGINEIGERTPVYHADVSGKIASVVEGFSLRTAPVRENVDEAWQHGPAEAACEGSDASSASFSAHSENTLQALSRGVCFHPFGGHIIRQTSAFRRLLSKPSKKEKKSNMELLWEKPALFTSWIEDVIHQICMDKVEAPCFRTFGPEKGKLKRDRLTGLKFQKTLTLEVCFPPLLVDPHEYCVNARVLSMKCSQVAGRLSAFPEHKTASARLGGPPKMDTRREASGSPCSVPGGGDDDSLKVDFVVSDAGLIVTGSSHGFDRLVCCADSRGRDLAAFFADPGQVREAVKHKCGSIAAGESDLSCSLRIDALELAASGGVSGGEAAAAAAAAWVDARIFFPKVSSQSAGSERRAVARFAVTSGSPPAASREPPAISIGRSALSRPCSL